ncbi:hypothetical protein FSP39_005078 [Pinctada imbricata]|uniref:NADH dehydrogenase [ubiquinone] 1 beta subcomplex subunit 5, mitochondrial n=1 Tax=Pinctada imbricata TaxID=66713 RepID=A0AA88YGB2_PINIB|nr:hypothetical protein FSP39_005078 [Pinctada imbricata]
MQLLHVNIDRQTNKEKHYLQDPVERFMAKYIFSTPEKQYERNLHYVYMKNEYDRMSKMQSAVQRHMKRNQDFKGWYYIPTPTTPLSEATMGVESLGEPASEINI